MNSTKKSLLAGSVSGVIQLIFISLLALLSIPLFIHKLGAENYGLFSLLSLILTLPFFAGLGLNRSLVKFIARQGPTPESRSDILATLIIQLTLLIAIISAILLFQNFFLHNILGLPPEPIKQSPNLNISTSAHQHISLFHSLLLTTLFLTLTNLASSVLSALQRVWLVNLLQMFYNLLFYGSMILLLLLNYGLPEIGCGILLSSILTFLLSLIITKIHWQQHPSATPPLRPSAPLPLRHSAIPPFRKQLTSGLPIYTAEFIAYFTEPLSRILIAHFIGIRETGYFDIALRIKAMLQGLFTRLYDPIFPWIAGVGEKERIGRALRNIEFRYLLLALPVLAAIPFLMKPLLNLWLGSANNPLIVTSSIALTITFLVTMSVLPLYYYLLAKEHTPKAILLNLATLATNLLLFFIFLPLAGYYAAIIALCISALINMILSVHFQNQQLFRHSATPPFRHSAIPPLRHSAIPPFRPSATLLFILLLLLFTGFLISLLPGAMVWLIIPVIPVLAALLYRAFRLVTAEDIEKYLGREHTLGRLLYRFFALQTFSFTKNTKNTRSPRRNT